jgi:hypothetical protein
LAFSDNLAIGFKEDIEYLLFYDDSIDLSGKEGIVIVRKNEDFYLLFKEHRGPLFTAPLNYYENGNNISSMSLIKEESCLVLTLDENEPNVVNSFIIPNNLYFRFYNIPFLILLIELFERIKSEI